MEKALPRIVSASHGSLILEFARDIFTTDSIFFIFLGLATLFLL
jgi:hypothetical protein